jgi:hypothetical protein
MSIIFGEDQPVMMRKCFCRSFLVAVSSHSQVHSCGSSPSRGKRTVSQSCACCLMAAVGRPRTEPREPS